MLLLLAIFACESGTLKQETASVAQNLNHELLKAATEQMMKGTLVSIGRKSVKVERTGSRKFRTLRLNVDGREYQLIEQNPDKSSRWGKLARDGHQVVQVRDVDSGKYVAAVVDGKVLEYGRLKRRQESD
jgi:hypothetical protein